MSLKPKDRAKFYLNLIQLHENHARDMQRAISKLYRENRKLRKKV